MNFIEGELTVELKTVPLSRLNAMEIWKICASGCTTRKLICKIIILPDYK